MKINLSLNRLEREKQVLALPKWARWLLIVLAGIGTAVISLLISSWIVKIRDGMRIGDFYTFWLAGRMLWQGQDIYNHSQWLAQHEATGTPLTQIVLNPAFLYPLPLALLFIPFGFFSLAFAGTLWLALSIILFAIAIHKLSIDWHLKNGSPYWIPFFIGMFLFRPLFGTLLLGQIDAPLVLGLVFVVRYWKHNKWFAGGLLLPLLLLKPQLGFPVVGLIGFWLVYLRKWNAIVGLAVTSFLLLILGLIVDPYWIMHWLSIGQTKVSSAFGLSSTIWGTAGWLCGYRNTCVIAGGSVASLLLIILCVAWLVKSKEKDPVLATSLCVCFGLLLPPYMWFYDQIFLVIPIMAVMKLMIDKRYPYLLASTVMIIMAILSMSMVGLALRLNTDAWSISVPLLALLYIWLVAYSPLGPKLEWRR